MMNLVSFVMAMVALTLYFIPTMVALTRRHHNAMPIFLTNLYLGITFLGWVVSLIWAFSTTSSTNVVQPEASSSNNVSVSKKGFVSFLKYAGMVIAAVVILFVLVAFFMPSATPPVNDASLSSGAPMSADDMFTTPVNGAK